MKRQRRIIQTIYSLLTCVVAAAGITVVSPTQGDEPTVTITRIDPLVRLFPDLPAPASFSANGPCPARWISAVRLHCHRLARR